MTRIYVKPTPPNLVIRDPSTGLQIPPEGKEVQDNSYWRRRILDGDLEISKPPRPAMSGKKEE